jgi:putative ABC transport system permease protein
VGVVAHQRFTSLAEPGREQEIIKTGFTSFCAPKWEIRTTGDPAASAALVRAAVARFDPAMVVADLAPMTTLVQRAQAATRFTLLLIGVFTVIASLLVGVGLYGVLSTVVRQRTAEIGVRVALGAQPSSILGMVVGQGLRLSAAGVAIGLVAAYTLTRLMATLLVGVRATDPPTFIVMVMVFFVIAVISSWLPAHRAAALDPTTALRE